MVIAILGLAGCAMVSCRATPVTVAQKEERTRLESEFRGVRTDQLGRVQELRRDVVVHEFWIKADDGDWFRVSEAVWRAVKAGESLEVCR